MDGNRKRENGNKKRTKTPQEDGPRKKSEDETTVAPGRETAASDSLAHRNALASASRLIPGQPVFRSILSEDDDAFVYIDFPGNLRIADNTPAIPNRSENPAPHRGLIDSGQDANSTAIECPWAREPS
jgi:hypothetical protein